MTEPAAAPADDDAEAGDAAFLRLLTEGQLALRSYLRVLMPGHPAAADVFQQANAKLWERRRDFRPGTDFAAWSLTVLKYEVLTARKREARERLRFSGDLEETVAAELAAFDARPDERADALRHGTV